MQAGLASIAEFVALAAELATTALIALGIVDACARLAIHIAGLRISLRPLKDVWLRLAGWILLALEFALAADIVRTSISPSWDQIGRLAAIAAIRTVLSIFVERDLSKFERSH